MLKKLLLIAVAAFSLMLPGTKVVHGEPAEEQIEMPLNGTSGLLMDCLSGQIIIAKNINQKLFPASMTKMMGMLLVEDALASGILKEDQIISVSADAASMGGSQVYLEAGEKMSVRDLFKAVCISSANDAMYALGEAVSGNIQLFIKAMNNKAKELNMHNTNFVNVSGFDDPKHYTTAHDMAMLACKLIKTHGDKILSLTSQIEGYIRENSEKPFWLVNTNKMINSYDGMDGLKTGFTNLAGYCLTATAKRDNLRFIAVSMNNKTIKDRTDDIKSMLDYGFANYKAVKIYEKGEVIATTTFKYAKEKSTSLIFDEDVYITMRKTDNEKDITESYSFFITSAPIKQLAEVGTISIKNKEGITFHYNFHVASKVTLLKWYDYFFIRLKALIF